MIYVLSFSYGVYSWVALDRLVEKKIATDAELREQIAGRALRSHAKRISDGDLLARLHSVGIELDRASLGRLVKESLSAQAIAFPQIEKCNFKTLQEEQQGDWVLVCVDALWQRWFPDAPSFEMLDDLMQEGYELLASRHVQPACRVWVDAWDTVTQLCDKGEIHSIYEFDQQFKGTQCVFNWIQDLESELWNAALQNRQFHHHRIMLCDEALMRFEEKEDNDLPWGNFQVAMAESYFEVGDIAAAEDLYREWLEEDPQWGWGWISWADRYAFSLTEARNLDKAESLIHQGLAIDGLRDREDVIKRMETFKQLRVDAAAKTRDLLGENKKNFQNTKETIEISPGLNVVRIKKRVTFDEEGLPLDEIANLARLFRESPSTSLPVLREKAGRNDPCPCGSGRKFKKCCGQ